MRAFDPGRDPWLGEVLRRMLPKPPGQKSVDGLAVRICGDAEALLEARRRERAGWAEYVAHWSSTLVPLGVMTALAAGLCLAWLAHQQQTNAERMAERAALLGVATGGAASGDLVDLATTSDPLPAPQGRRR